MARILALDAAGVVPVAGITDDGQVVLERAAADLAGLARLIEGLPSEAIDAVAVTVGPGSFTGLRAALALASGFAAARGVALVPVTVAEALGAALPRLGERSLWVAIDSRRGRIFLDTGTGMRAVAPHDLPPAGGPVAVAGDAAPAVAAWLAARGADVMLTDPRRPRPRDIGRAAARRLDGTWPPLAPLPLYVDPPEAKFPAHGLRPAPV